jgi:hypothetical protein
MRECTKIVNRLKTGLQWNKFIVTIDHTFGEVITSRTHSLFIQYLTLKGLGDSPNSLNYQKVL